MCEITKKVKHPTSKIVPVWKCINAKSTADTWFPLLEPGSYPRGKWVRAMCGPGFNCYATRCRRCGLQYSYWSTNSIRCYARFIEGYGKIGRKKVLFAREIFVPRGRKSRKWKH